MWYFIWPSMCNNSAYEFRAGNFVGEREFFQLMHAMERVPLRSGWPHASTLYRQLCGKLWIPQMCLNKGYRVPVTVHIHHSDFKRDADRAAEKALNVMTKLSKK